MANRVKQYRTKQKMSQRELADRAGTSQQQIQRIETGKIAARLDLATRIASALGQQLNQVFPGSGKALAKLATEQKSGYTDSGTLSEVSETGVEADFSYWTMRFGLRGHQSPMYFDISAEVKRRLFRLVQDEQLPECGVSFVVFDTAESRIAINLSELIYCQFLFEAFPGGKEAKKDSDLYNGVDVYFSGSAEKQTFEAEFEPADSDDEDRNDRAYFRNMFFMLEARPMPNDRFYFQDADGEDVFLRYGDLAMVRVPLGVLEEIEEVTSGEECEG